jgi:glycerophosphoryl diester phosphodiesterase
MNPLPSRRHFLATGLLALPALSLAEKPVLPARGFCAHRGAMATHPENTLPAFDEAIRLGAAMIEFDVQLTRDGALVLMHDATVDRTTDGRGKVAELTLTEIQQLDAGVRKDPRFAGTRIPTFTEALDRLPRDLWVNCHLKGDGALGGAVAREIARLGRLDQAFVAAEKEAARGAREAVSEILLCNMERQSATIDYVRETITMKAAFIQLRGKGEIDPDHTRHLHEAGVRINYYETATPEIARKLLDAGVDFPLVNDLAAFVPLAREADLLRKA